MAQLIFDEKTVTLGDLLANEKTRTNREVAELLARCAFSDDGDKLSDKDAWKYICTLTFEQVVNELKRFYMFCRGVKENAVNPPSEPASSG